MNDRNEDDNDQSTTYADEKKNDLVDSNCHEEQEGEEGEVEDGI